MRICERVLGWASLDVKFLKDLVNELEENSNYDLDHIVNEVKSVFGDTKDINSYIYVALQFIEIAMKEKLIEHNLTYEEKILEVDSKIYVNYLDSGFNSPFQNYSLKDLDDVEKAKELLEELEIELYEDEYNV